MKKMSNIRKGKIIEVVSFVFSILMLLVTEAAEQSYKNNVIQNLQGIDKMRYEMGLFEVQSPDFVLPLLGIAFASLFIGRIIASCMCTCPNCGHSVMTRYGNIHRHCPNCGKKVEY